MHIFFCVLFNLIIAASNIGKCQCRDFLRRSWYNFFQWGNIRYTTLHSPFFPKIWGFVLKKLLSIYDSKYSTSLATTFFHLTGNCWIPSRKTMRLLRRSTNRSIFWLLHKSGNADEPGRVPSIETNGSRKEQCLENMAGRVRLPILAFPSMSWPVLRHMAEHCHVGG